MESITLVTVLGSGLIGDAAVAGKQI